MDDQTPDLGGLQSFARQTDREESPIFVGREQELAHIVVQADEVGEAHAQGRATQGRTMVITGCPGSGKSAFLGHFARTFASLDLVETALIPVPCNHQDLSATDSRELQAQIGALALEKKGGLDKTLQALASDLGTKLKMEKTLGALEARVAEGSGKRTVVCLLVDEIQNVTGASAAAMQLLHTHAFSPPVLPVYAGLDDSAEQLERVCGISRLGTNAQMTMGALRENSAREATQLLFEKYRVRSTGKAQAAWKEAIEKEALAFGQHLHIALQAACTVLTAAGGEAHAQDATEVKQRARAAREHFYASKTTGVVQEHAEAVLDVVHKATHARTRVTKGRLTRWAKDAMGKHSALTREYSDDEALALVERLRRRGIIQLSRQGDAEIPIPSLKAWLTGPYARHIGWHQPRNAEREDRGRSPRAG